MADVTRSLAIEASFDDDVSPNVRKLADRFIRDTQRIERQAAAIGGRISAALNVATELRLDLGGFDQAVADLKDLAEATGDNIRSAEKLEEVMERLANTAEDDLADGVEKATRELTDYRRQLEQTSGTTLGSIRNTQNLSGQLTKFAGALGLTVGAAEILRRGMDNLNRIISSSVEASLAHDRVLRQVETNLQKTGQASRVSARAMDVWAESLQDATGTSSDAILSGSALALSMGATAEQAQAATAAALDMAAAMGTDLGQAIRQISRTLGGYAGELTELIPEVRDLTREQLRSGEAIDLVAQKYLGAARAIAQTREGQIRRLREDLADVRQEFGALLLTLADTPGATERGASALGALASRLRSIADGIQAVKSAGLNELATDNGFGQLARDIGGVLVELSGVEQAFQLTKAAAKSLVEDIPFIDLIGRLEAAGEKTRQWREELSGARSDLELMSQAAREVGDFQLGTGIFEGFIRGSQIPGGLSGDQVESLQAAVDQAEAAQTDIVAIFNTLAQVFPVQQARELTVEMVAAGKGLREAESSVIRFQTSMELFREALNVDVDRRINELSDPRAPVPDVAPDVNPFLGETVDTERIFIAAAEAQHEYASAIESGSRKARDAADVFQRMDEALEQNVRAAFADLVTDMITDLEVNGNILRSAWESLVRDLVRIALEGSGEGGGGGLFGTLFGAITGLFTAGPPGAVVGAGAGSGLLDLGGGRQVASQELDRTLIPEPPPQAPAPPPQTDPEIRQLREDLRAFMRFTQALPESRVQVRVGDRELARVQVPALQQAIDRGQVRG